MKTTMLMVSLTVILMLLGDYFGGLKGLSLIHI